MNLDPGLFDARDLNLETLVAEAKTAGFKVLLLKQGISTREALFDAVRQSLPLDPPIVSSRSWDALSDSLWGGLASLDQDRILILWPSSTTMATSSPRDYETAVEVLKDVIASLANDEATQGRAKRLSVILG